VLCGRGEIQLRLPANAWIDLEAAEEAIHRAEAAVAQHDWTRGWGPSLIAMFTARRGFLLHEDLPSADEYRQRLEEIYICALECYTAVALGIGGSELPPGERTARELIKLAPYREHGHALLMEILTARGMAPRRCASTSNSANACATNSARPPHPNSANSNNACSNAEPRAAASLDSAASSPTWPGDRCAVRITLVQGVLRGWSSS
jgi:DNA-binding SARP family transcriptional activator